MADLEQLIKHLVVTSGAVDGDEVSQPLPQVAWGVRNRVQGEINRSRVLIENRRRLVRLVFGRELRFIIDRRTTAVIINFRFIAHFVKKVPNPLVESRTTVTKKYVFLATRNICTY